MKISLLLPTRGRPDSAIRAINSALDLASDPANIEIVVGVDKDDPHAETLLRHYAARFGPHGASEATWAANVRVIAQDRFDTLGALTNSLAALAAGDIIGLYVDDVVIATPGWDAITRETVGTFTNGIGIAFPFDPQVGAGFCGEPFISRAMYQALIEVQGFFLPEYFPFWFNDTWTNEIGDLANVKASMNWRIELPDGRGETHNLRDVKLWATLFEATRQHRVAAAMALREKAGLAELNALQLQREIAACALRTAHLTTPQFISDWESRAGAMGAPTQRYLDAKARALALLDALRAQARAPNRTRVGAFFETLSTDELIEASHILARKAPIRGLRIVAGIPSNDTWHAKFGMCLSGLLCSSLYDFALMPLGGHSSVVAEARNICLAQASQAGADAILFLDTDMVFPPDTLHRLVAMNKPIAAATYRQRNVAGQTLGTELDGSPCRLDGGSDIREMADLPTGCMLIRRPVWEAMKAPVFRFSVDEARHTIIGEDVLFCRMARGLGFSVWLDPILSAELGHEGSFVFPTGMPSMDPATGKARAA